MRVKICGITNAEDLLLADAAGADFAGLILWPGSKRFVPLARLAGLARVPVRLRRVGVFVNAAPAEIARAVRVGRLDCVQLYGCAFRRTGVDVWGATADAPGSVRVLDAAPGAGVVGDWARAARLARRLRLVLAGGLTPDNVAAAVAAVRPWCVDVAGGTEAAPGRKDPEKVFDFIRKAKQ